MRKLTIDELNRISVEEFKNAEKIPVIVVLDNIRSLNNIGSVFRTCDAFRIEKIWLCGITATPPHKDIHKTALGATDSVLWEYREDTVELIRELKETNTRIISVEQVENSKSLQELKLDSGMSYALVFGHEVRGVSQEVIDISDECIEIPQFGTKHSLNVSVSAGIVIWEVFRKLNASLL